MIRKTAVLILCALLILSPAASAFGLEKSIQPISDTGNIDNRGRSVEATIPVSGGYNVMYQKTCLSAYDGTPCIAVVTKCSENLAGINYAASFAILRRKDV